LGQSQKILHYLIMIRKQARAGSIRLKASGAAGRERVGIVAMRFIRRAR